MNPERKQRILEKMASKAKIMGLSDDAIALLSKRHPFQAKRLESIRLSRPAGKKAARLPKGSDAQKDAIYQAQSAQAKRGQPRAIARGVKTPLRSEKMETLVRANKKVRSSPENKWGMIAEPGRQAEQATYGTMRGGNVGTPGAAGRPPSLEKRKMTRWDRFFAKSPA